MYCPRCGSPTEVRASYLVCTATGMDFSQVVRRELAELVASKPTTSETSQVRWGGSWYCPADATPMNEVEGRVICPSCDRSLPPRLLYQLIEFHVHPKAAPQ